MAARWPRRPARGGLPARLPPATQVNGDDTGFRKRTSLRTERSRERFTRTATSPPGQLPKERDAAHPSWLPATAQPGHREEMAPGRAARLGRRRAAGREGPRGQRTGQPRSLETLWAFAA